MRRSEVSMLRWADVVDATAGDGTLVTVRRSKTNQEGEVNDVRFVKDGVARHPYVANRDESGAGRPGGCRCQRRLIGLRLTAAAAGTRHQPPDMP